MSEPSKIEFLQKAKEQGYRNYLYFVATDEPLININRVAERVLAGGHDVPTDKIVARYYRTLTLLLPALRVSSRAYLFDNSHTSAVCFAKTEEDFIEYLVTPLPHWFEEYVVRKLQEQSDLPNRALE